MAIPGLAIKLVQGWPSAGAGQSIKYTFHSLWTATPMSVGGRCWLLAYSQVVGRHQVCTIESQDCISCLLSKRNSSVKHGRISRGIHRLPKVSLKQAIPYHSMPYMCPLLKRPSGHFRVATHKVGSLRPSYNPFGYPMPYAFA
jgi:hypothetical protein